MFVSTPHDIVDLIKPYARKKQMQYGVICLDCGRNVISKKVMFVGTCTQAPVGLREVLSYSLKKDCCALISFNTRPSGNTEPSEYDKNTAKKIKEGCATVGIQFLDHIIISKNGYTSFLESHTLEDEPVVKMA